LVVQLRARRAQVVIKIRGGRIAPFAYARIDGEGRPSIICAQTLANALLRVAVRVRENARRYCTRVPKSGTANVRHSWSPNAETACTKVT